MAQKEGKQPETNSKKRKNPPAQPASKQGTYKKQKVNHQARRRDARLLATQTTSKAFQHGSLDVDKFVKAREFEIRALEQGMQNSKKALTKRAFQQVPRELRRRTASHNAKRVPKRLRSRAKKEMAQDQTPTVDARKRKLSAHKRLRVETVKSLRALGARRRAERERKDDSKTESTSNVVKPANGPATEFSGIKTSVQPRTPKIKKASLSKPPTPKAKFRKRQLHKSWLPTHLFHAKRAHMTPPSSPLWRFAIPLTPTQKSYRPMHRASSDRGAVAWDMSYMSTIGLAGEQKSIEGMLTALRIPMGGQTAFDRKWKRGTRALEAFIYEREPPHRLIAPATILWCVAVPPKDGNEVDASKRKRQLFVRTHPSAFLQIWEEIVRLAKVAKPSVTVEDLRFEIGSVDVTGPGSTEALLSAIRPFDSVPQPDGQPNQECESNAVERTWVSLAALTNPSILPAQALLAFEAQDPRLRFPPRTLALPNTSEADQRLLETIAAWPIDEAQAPSPLFDRFSRMKASKLPSQKSINRRKSLADPGEYPSPRPSDPRFPIILYASNTDRKNQSTWTLLAPWKCIQPLWYSVVFYPLSTGQQPRFAGIREKQQLAFEAGRPWYPADFPGTQAGWDWEVKERQQRWSTWARRPRSKRTVWEKVDLGGGRKGEHGHGWTCHWELLFDITTEQHNDAAAAEAESEKGKEATEAKNKNSKDESKQAPSYAPTKPKSLCQIASTTALAILKSHASIVPQGGLTSIRLSLLNGGVPQTCARIYRLPTDSALRVRWLALHPSKQPRVTKKQKSALPKVSDDTPAHIVHQRLAQSLLEPRRPGRDDYPHCPGTEDLVGFVTSGNFNLAEGKGTGIGCVTLEKVVADVRADGNTGRLCVVRNAGESVARLAVWEIV